MSENLRSTAAAQSAPSKRQVREPRAARSATLVDSGASPTRHGGTAGHAGHTAARKAKRKVYCGNYRMAKVLLDGSERVGRPSERIQRGFGAALHQRVEDAEAFVRMHSGAYEKLIDPNWTLGRIIRFTKRSRSAMEGDNFGR